MVRPCGCPEGRVLAVAAWPLNVTPLLQAAHAYVVGQLVMVALQALTQRNVFAQSNTQIQLEHGMHHRQALAW